jgi:rubrerythrin
MLDLNEGESMVTQQLTALEALGIAIRHEIDAQELYKDLAAKTENELMKDRFLNLYQAQKKHQFLLEKKYKEMFPNVDLKIPPSQLPKEIFNKMLGKNLSLSDVLKIAINLEKKAKEFFLDCAEEASDLSGKRMFRFLADMKFSYLGILNAELEVIEKYPAYYEETKSWDVESKLKSERIKRN